MRNRFDFYVKSIDNYNMRCFCDFSYQNNRIEKANQKLLDYAIGREALISSDITDGLVGEVESVQSDAKAELSALADIVESGLNDNFIIMYSIELNRTEESIQYLKDRINELERSTEGSPDVSIARNEIILDRLKYSLRMYQKCRDFIDNHINKLRRERGDFNPERTCVLPISKIFESRELGYQDATDVVGLAGVGVWRDDEQVETSGSTDGFDPNSTEHLEAIKHILKDISPNNK